MSDAPVQLWRHPNPEATQIWAFKERINAKYHLKLETYDQLYHWSIQNIAEFWGETWHFTGIKASRQYDKVRGCGFLTSRDSILPLIFPRYFLKRPDIVRRMWMDWVFGTPRLSTVVWAFGDEMAFSITFLKRARTPLWQRETLLL